MPLRNWLNAMSGFMIAFNDHLHGHILSEAVTPNYLQAQFF